MIQQSPNQPETLAEFFEQTFKPERLSDRAPATVERWDAAVRIFLEFAGDDNAVATIAERRLSAFGDWCVDKSLGDSAADDHIRRIRSIVSASKPPEPDAGDERRRAARRTALDCTAPEGSLRRYFDIDYVAWRDLTKRTIEHYHASIKSLEKFCDYVVMLDDLTDDLVNSFLLDKQDRGNKPRTVASARTDIMALWRSAVQDGKIDALPRRVRRIKVPREIITA